jgi:hypothetical protein
MDALVGDGSEPNVMADPGDKADACEPLAEDGAVEGELDAPPPT